MMASTALEDEAATEARPAYSINMCSRHSALQEHDGARTLFMRRLTVCVHTTCC